MQQTRLGMNPNLAGGGLNIPAPQWFLGRVNRHRMKKDYNNETRLA